MTIVSTASAKQLKFERVAVAELSLFIDESGDVGSESRYYLVSFVMHEQSKDVLPGIILYENNLAFMGLKDIPFHFNPLINANQEYKDMNIETRKKLLASFRIMVEKLPFRYHLFAYQKRLHPTGPNSLEANMRRDVRDFLFDNFDFFCAFDKVKVYYDNGQSLITRVLQDAMNQVFSKNVIVFKDASPSKFRLQQVADYVCGIELTALKYEQDIQTRTDERFFGMKTSFKKNVMRKLRKHRM